MDKIKRFIDCYIPTETCNFRCHYCYIAQHRKFNNKVAKFTYSPNYIRKALSKERLGGTCMLNLCVGGETLIAEEVIDVTKELLKEGHYVMIVTNGSLTNRFKKISQFPKELINHLFFKFSFHYLELKRMNILDNFFENVDLMKKSGASFTIEITPNDELEPYIEEIKKISLKKLGALPHITIGRKDSNDIPPLTEHKWKDYIKVWEQFDSELFKFKKSIFGIKRNEFCYAGDWSSYLNLVTGDLRQCYCGIKIDNIYEEIDRQIKFLPIGNNCTMPHCYNGHAFLSFGDIPELDTPTYDILRNRKCKDGSEWLTEDMKKFMQSKLKDSNKELEDIEKKKVNKKVKRAIILSKVKGKFIK